MNEIARFEMSLFLTFLQFRDYDDRGVGAMALYDIYDLDLCANTVECHQKRLSGSKHLYNSETRQISEEDVGYAWRMPTQIPSLVYRMRHKNVLKINIALFDG